MPKRKKLTQDHDQSAKQICKEDKRILKHLRQFAMQVALMKPAWKVVRRRRQVVSVTGQRGGIIFCSATHEGRTYAYSHDYILKPMEGDGPLAVFKNKTLANAFVDKLWKWRVMAEGHGSLHVLPCRYKPSRCKSIWVSPFGQLRRPLRSLPKGTILADAVILMKE